MGKGAAAVAQWMGHPERFADLFNGKVFQGAQIVLAEDLWDASQELYEMMDMNELIKEFPELQDHVQNYKLNLVDAEKIENVELFQSDLHQVFGMLKYRTDKEKLVNYMKQNSNYFGDLDRETSMVISELLHSEDILENVENTEEGERVNMCKALEDLHNDGIERGIEGMLEGLKDVGFSMEESMNRVSLKFDKTLEEVQKFAEKLWEV